MLSFSNNDQQQQQEEEQLSRLRMVQVLPLTLHLKMENCLAETKKNAEKETEMNQG